MSSYSIDPNNPTANGQLTFDDEFNNLSLWNGKSGTWDTTWWYNDQNPTASSTLTGNGEQEWYINANDSATSSVKPWSVSNGALNIQAAAAPSSLQSSIDGYQYTSGMLNTYHSFSQTYGLFEAKMKLPAGQGLWPAFWLLPENGNWPPELDVMENLGNDTNSVYTTVHSNQLPNTYVGQKDAVTDTTQWHTYAVDWEPDTTTFYVDGKQVDQIATPKDMNSPMYMILNLAAGGGWPGDVNSSTPLPANMQVDWVKAYQSDANGGNPTGVVAGGGTGSSGGNGSTGGNGSGGNGVGNAGGAMTSHNYLGDGHSDILMENTAGTTVVGEVGSNGQLSYSNVGGLGPEWKFGGSGDFTGQGHDQYVIQNSSGAIDVANVVNGQAQYTQVGQVGTEWSQHGAGTYLNDGKTQFLMENTNGVIATGEVGSNGQATYTTVGQVGSEWKIVGSGDYLGLGAGHDQFLMENTNGTVDVATVGSNGQATYTTVAGLGSEWKFVGTGDYTGDGKDQFLIENTNGTVAMGEVGSNGQASYTNVAGLGSEWKFVGTSDVQGAGHDQAVIENTAGTVVAADISSGQAHYTTIGGVGQEWAFHM